LLLFVAEAATVAVPFKTAVLGPVFLIGAMVLLPGPSRATADPALEKLGRLLAEARGAKAQLEMVLSPQVLDRLKADKEQVKEIRKILKDMGAEFARKWHDVHEEAYDSDNEGPAWAARQAPELSDIVRRARGKICFEVLTAEQYRVLRAAWDDAEKKKAQEERKGAAKK